MSYSSEVLADSPLAYWRLGEASGTTFADSSGNGRGGAYTGTYTVGATGLLTGDSDLALSLGGAGFGSMSSAAWMNTANITLEGVIKPSAIGSYMNIQDRDNAGIRQFQFRVTNAGKLQFLYWLGGGGFGPYQATGATTLVAGTIYHVAATHDGTTAKVWLNGVVDGTNAQTGSLTAITYDWVIGASSSGGSLGTVQRFSGILDELAVYGSALSSTRIGVHAAAVTSGGGGGGGGTRPGFHLPTPIRRAAVVRSSSM